jgi:hypothetical protein
MLVRVWYFLATERRRLIHIALFEIQEEFKLNPSGGEIT